MAESQHTPNSSVSSSRSVSLWSHSHSNMSSGSSMSFTSSPVPTRDSLDLFEGQKRLEDVREEEDISSRHMVSFDDYRSSDLPRSYANEDHSVSHMLGASPGYSLSETPDRDAWSLSSGGRHQPKRHRSLDRPRHAVTQGLTSTFGSLSRRWRNRSTIGPRLSIITNAAPLASPRSSVDTANYQRRSASITSNTHGIYSPVSMHSFMDEPIPESEVVPIYIDQRSTSQEEQPEDQAQATTPLLPPTMLNLQKPDSPIQSPLQSPSIAPAARGPMSRLSMDLPPYAYLPSPPLSSRPSLASMPRSRANTATLDIPNLQQLGERLDPWSLKLGHADFSIHPEPYQPNIIDLDNLKEFRQNWDQARKQYAQHLARTIEHYGETSRVFKLTEEKWTFIDTRWKNTYDELTNALAPQLARLSDGPPTPDSPISLLDKPVTRVVVPALDKSGKFPEIGDTDIVGPLTMGVAKVPELQRGLSTPPLSPRKRTFIKAVGDIFKRH